MKLFLILTLLALTSCRQSYYLSQYREDFIQLQGRGTAIAMVHCPARLYVGQHQVFDFVVGTSDGFLYFGNSQDSSVTYNASVSDFGINNLTWEQSGYTWNDHQIRIATKYEIKVINAWRGEWNLLYMRFNEQIKNAVFGSKGYDIMIAVSFTDRIEVFENSTSIYNISVNQPCFAMSFNLTADNFNFITSVTPHGVNSMKRLDIATLTVYNTTLNSPYSQNYLQFSSAYGYYHIAVSTNSHSLVKWANQSYNQAKITLKFGKIKFTECGQYLVGQSTNSIFSIGILGISYDYWGGFINDQIQNFNFDSSVIDFDTKEQKIVVLTENGSLSIFKSQPIPNPALAQTDLLAIILFISILGFSLVLAISKEVISRKRIRKQRQQGDYVQQTEVTPKQDHSDINNTIQLNEQLLNKDEFNKNEGFNVRQSSNGDPYAPPKQIC